MAIQEGKAAPAFTLPDADGKKVSLKDFAGKDVILYFYPKDDTPGCTKEACGFRDHWKDLTKRGVVVLGVSADGAASHQKFVAKYKLPFPLLSDPDHAGDGEVRRVRREADVRQEGHGRDPLDGVDRPRREGEEALGEGCQGRGASGAGARRNHGRGLTRVARGCARR